MPVFRPFAAALALALSSTASAGVVIEGKDASEGEEAKVQRFLMEGQKLRIETAGGNEAMIFDGATKTSLQLDAEHKTYTEFTSQDLAKMKEMMKQGGHQPKVRSRKYEKTGKKDTALGKSCDVYRVVETGGDERNDEEMCVAPYGTFGVQRADFAPFRAFGDFASQLSGGELERSWADLPGVPLIAWETEGGQRKETFRATKVEKRSIPASEFSVPAGFKKGPSFSEQMQQAMPGGSK